MKKKSIIPLLISIALFTVSCEQNTNISETKIPSIEQANQYGEVNLIFDRNFNKRNSFSTKGVDFDNTDIRKIRLEIIGNGIDTPVSETKDWIPGQSVTFNLTVKTGKNRILKLYGLDAQGKTLSTLMGALNVNAGNNSGTISHFDTIPAQILENILKTNANLVENIDLDNLKKYVIELTGFDATKNSFNKLDPSSVDTIKVADFFLQNNSTLPSPTQTGFSGFGKIKVNLGTDITGAKISINDPNSAKIMETTTNETLIENITPGNWILTVKKEGYRTFTKEITVKNETNTAVHDVNLDWLFKNYVAIGDSLTAGYQSGALQQDKQEVSYPIVIAQSGGVKGSDFKQPYIAEANTGIGFGGFDSNLGRFIGEVKPDFSRHLLSITSPDQLSSLLKAATEPMPYNNLGIPGVTLEEAISAKISSEGKDNPFIDFILRKQGASEVDQAISKNPSLTTVWLGSNDVLGAATSGNSTAVTPPANFAISYDNLVKKLLAGTTSDIFVATVPDVTAIPFTSTIKVESFADADKKIAMVKFPIGPGQLSPLTPIPTAEADVEYFLITSLGPIQELSKGNITKLEGNYTLTKDEVASLKDTVSKYNTEIKKHADDNERINLVDTFKALNDVKAGNVAGQSLGFFMLDPNTGMSYDSTHPNTKGYKYVASLFLDEINKKYGFDLKIVDKNLSGSIGG